MSIDIVVFEVDIVKNNGKNIYNIDGIPQQSLNLEKGVTYRFIQKDKSNLIHPLNLSDTYDGIHNINNKGNPYNGLKVLTNNNENRIIELTVNNNTPNLHYYCENHAGMGGSINITRFGTGFKNSNTNNSGNSYSSGCNCG